MKTPNDTSLALKPYQLQNKNSGKNQRVKNIRKMTAFQSPYLGSKIPAVQRKAFVKVNGR
jgi:hypothetical protein